MKYVAVLLVLLSGASLCAAQSVSEPGKQEETGLSFSAGVGLGLASYERVDGARIAYQTVGLYPQVSWGNFGLGLDLTFDLDADFKLRDLDGDNDPDGWSDAIDVLTKMEYARWNFPGDPFFIEIASIHNYSVGHGLLMEDYNPSLFQPYLIQRGLRMGMDGSVIGMPVMGVEFMADDVSDWDVLASRLWIAPLGFVSQALRSFTVGFSAVFDLDPGEVPLSDDFGPPRDNPASSTISSFALDAELPLISGERSGLLMYADWAHIADRGSGALVGTELEYRWLLLRGQVRFSGDAFVPHFFDAYYELDRPVKYDLLDSVGSSTSYLAGAEFNLFDLVHLDFSWEQQFDAGGRGPRIRTGLRFSPDESSKLSASIAYDKPDVNDLEDFLELQDSLFHLSLTYRITDFASVQFVQERVFTPWGSSTKQAVLETRFMF